MPSANVSNAELLVRGLRTEFTETYARKIKGAEPALARVMDLNMPSDKLSEIYGYYESVPHWQRWNRGDEIPRNGMRARNFVVVNYDWAISIDWHEDDEQDDQSLSLVRRVRDAASDASLLPERVFFQILLGSTDAKLLPSVPNAPDGAAFFTSATRFGTTGGNIVASSGVATSAAIQADFFSAYSRFRAFQDTDSQPLWPSETINRGVLVIYGSQNEQAFRAAFQQMFNQGTQAAPSNLIIDTRMQVELWSTSRITTNSWYVFLTNSDTKAVFQQTRQAPRDTMEDMTNSDFTRRTKIKAMSWDARFGYGLSLPYQAIQVS